MRSCFSSSSLHLFLLVVPGVVSPRPLHDDTHDTHDTHDDDVVVVKRVSPPVPVQAEIQNGPVPVSLASTPESPMSPESPAAQAAQGSDLKILPESLQSRPRADSSPYAYDAGNASNGGTPVTTYVDGLVLKVSSGALHLTEPLAPHPLIQATPNPPNPPNPQPQDAHLQDQATPNSLGPQSKQGNRNNDNGIMNAVTTPPGSIHPSSLPPAPARLSIEAVPTIAPSPR